MNQARIKEDSAIYADAFYYYHKIVEFDSQQVEAIKGLHRADSLFLIKRKAQTSKLENKTIKNLKQMKKLKYSSSPAFQNL